MSARTKLAAFALVLAGAFGLGYGVGEAAGPFDDDTTPEVTDGHEHDWGAK